MKYVIKRNTGAYFQGITLDSRLPMFGPIIQASIFDTLKTAKNIIKSYNLEDCLVIEIHNS
jgi:hypothetical protein